MPTPANGLAIRDERRGDEVYRTCKQCGRTLLLCAENFHHNKQHFTGFDLECSQCANQSSYRAMRKNRTTIDQRRRARSSVNRDMEHEINEAKKRAMKKFCWSGSGFASFGEGEP